MTRRGASLRDVARLAGVSPGTASRVLSGSSYPVSEDARRRVEEAARTLNYVANSVARALVTGRTAVLGAIVHDITDPYFNGVVRGFQDAAVANGLVVLVGNDDRDARKLERYLTMMLSQMPAGVVLVGGQLRDPAAVLPVAQAVQRLRDQGVPVVAVGRYELDIPHVSVDDASAARAAVTYLLRNGHRRIAFVGGPPNSTTIEDRYAGYVAALAAAGVPVDERLVIDALMTLEGGSAAAGTLADRGADPSAAFCTTDEVAFGLVSGLRERGLTVPGDVSVVGMNDVPMSAHADPPLTTVHVPDRDLGAAAWQLLVAEWRGETPAAADHLPFELVVRDSTAPARRRGAGGATARDAAFTADGYGPEMTSGEA
jgi:DNA-binding LacI/PurR family transcriptional regulator